MTRTGYNPSPLNQFNRLIEQKRLTDYTLGAAWNNRRVIHGPRGPVTHDFDSENCMASMGGVALDAASGGKHQTSPGAIRNAQSDFSGGIGMDDINDAFRKLGYGAYQLTIPYGADWGDAMDLAREERFVVVAVDYGDVPYTYQEQKGGNFAHALGFCDVDSAGRLLRYDSLGQEPKRLPQVAVRAGAEAYALKAPGRYSKARLYIGYTRIIVPAASSGVQLRYGGKPVARGRYIAAKVPLIPVRTSPRQDAPVFYRMRPGIDTMKVAQTTQTGDSFQGSTVWHGTADGKCWVATKLLRFAGASTGKETVR